MTSMPFDSHRRVMSTLAKSKDRDCNTLFLKGDPKAVVGIAGRVLLRDATLEPLTDIAKQRIMADVRRMAAKGLKVLAVAYKKDNGDLNRFGGIDDRSKPATTGMLKDAYNYRTIEDGCDLIGFVGIADPVRDDVRRQVVTCNRAGI